MREARRARSRPAAGGPSGALPGVTPLTAADLERLQRVPAVRTVRRALRLTQSEFAARYRIPLATLRDWEEGRAQPDAAAQAYLQVIARDPERLAGLLRSRDG